MPQILYDAGPLTIAKLVGLEFFSPTGLTQPYQVDQVWLDSFCFAFFALITQQDFDNLWMSRLQLIETGINVGCRNRDSAIRQPIRQHFQGKQRPAPKASI